MRALALLSGLLAFVLLDGLAHAQPLVEIAAGPPPFVPPTPEEFGIRAALAVGLIVGLVRMLRGGFPVQLAPEGGSLAAKRWLIFVCSSLGILFALVGFAPAVVAGVAGQVIGGLGTGAAAYALAAVVGPAGRLEKPVGPPTPL